MSDTYGNDPDEMSKEERLDYYLSLEMESGEHGKGELGEDFFTEYYQRKDILKALQNGFPTAEYVTEKTIDNANKDHQELSLIKERRHNNVCILWKEQNEQTYELEKRRACLYNVAQTTNSEKMKA